VTERWVCLSQGIAPEIKFALNVLDPSFSWVWNKYKLQSFFSTLISQTPNFVAKFGSLGNPCLLESGFGCSFPDGAVSLIFLFEHLPPSRFFFDWVNVITRLLPPAVVRPRSFWAQRYFVAGDQQRCSGRAPLQYFDCQLPAPKSVKPGPLFR